MGLIRMIRVKTGIAMDWEEVLSKRGHSRDFKDNPRYKKS
jgi:hypothetical protein